MNRWPKLSETLPFPRQLDTCQVCGQTSLPDELRRWRECDDQDKPTLVLVILCPPCSKRLIEPHPRLYHGLELWEPWPGAMALCVECRHRTGAECRHPDLKANGGSGLEVRFPQPDVVHLNYGRGRGRWAKMYKGPATSCAGRDIAQGATV